MASLAKAVRDGRDIFPHYNRGEEQVQEGNGRAGDGMPRSLAYGKWYTIKELPRQGDGGYPKGHGGIDRVRLMAWQRRAA